MLQSWWRDGLKSRRQARRSKPSRTRTVRPRTEVLEDRTLLSATLFKDINTTTVSSVPPLVAANPVAINNTLFFAADDGIHGAQLWKSDGTAAGTVMVKDINPSGPSNPTQLTNVNGTLFFTADDGTHGAELWKSDGTAGGTVMVKNIWTISPPVLPGGPVTPSSSNPQQLTNVNGKLFFTANDGLHGTELWKSDGTSTGTVMVKDINPGPTGSNPLYLTNVNGALFFTADDGIDGMELWKSDGTAAGTILVKDISPGSSSSTPSNLTNVNGTLFFAANDGVHGTELWKSDGTPTGTVMVMDINPGSAVLSAGGPSVPNSSYPTQLTNVNGTLFFAADDGIHGTELWKSDGTANGTVMVKDIWTGTGTPFPGAPVSANSSQPANLTNVNGTLYFSANDGIHGTELWKSDGTANGTVMVQDIFPGSGAASTSLPPPPVTPPFPGTSTIPNSSNPANLTNVNGTLYFSANDGVHGVELWKSDGTANGATLVKDINPGAASSNPVLFAAVNNTLFFFADDGVHGSELWKSNGSAGGTTLVKDINTSTGDAFPANEIVIGNTLYFTANDGVHGVELWKSDGTPGGTMMVKDINTTTATPVAYPFGSVVASSYPSELTDVNGILFFVADDGIHGQELWKSDGTAAGTVLVKDINPTLSSIYPRGVIVPVGSNIQDLTVFSGTLYFSATDGVHGQQLWKSDGTAAGTVMVKDINTVSTTVSPGGPAVAGNANPTDLTVFNGKLYFAADDGIHGKELWQSDGTAAGTQMVLDINPGSSILLPGSKASPNNSNPANLTVMDGALYFTADDGTHGRELWQSDGTAAGTHLVKDINPGSGSAFPPIYAFPTWGQSFTGLKVVNHTLFFSADDGVHGPQLWKSDGTAAGTVMVKDIFPGSSTPIPVPPIPLPPIWPGSGGSNISNLTDVNGTLFFTADDGTHGDELWMSDGTTAGTRMVKDINPLNGPVYPGGPAGPGSSFPANLTVYNGTLYFSANDGIHGTQLWRSDGTAEGTVMVQDIYPGTGSSGPNSSNPSNFVVLKGSLFFTATDGVHGYELWQLTDRSKPPTASAGGPYTLVAGQSLTLDASGSSDPSNGPLTYHWAIGDQVFDDATGVKPTLTWAQLQALGINSSSRPIEVRVEVRDSHGHVVVSPATTLTIQDLPLTGMGIALPLTEGTLYHGMVAIFSDPGGPEPVGHYSATINWGDGSPLTTGTITPAGALFLVGGTHAYAKNGSYTVRVTVRNNGAAAVTLTSTATVLDAPLQANRVVVQATMGQPFTGVVAAFKDANPLSKAIDFHATITWGDGHTSEGHITANPDGGFRVTGTNTFATAGNLPVVITIKDAGGSTVTAQSTAKVTGPVKKNPTPLPVPITTTGKSKAH
jgi:ELWxxDGT repeat protein